MKTNYVLVDGENVGTPDISLLKGEHFRVLVFLGPQNKSLNTELVLAMQQHPESRFVHMKSSGKNALDLHIAYYIGKIANQSPDCFFHIVSRDQGFDPLIKHLKAEGILAARRESITAIPVLTQVKLKRPPTNGSNDSESMNPLSQTSAGARPPNPAD